MLGSCWLKGTTHTSGRTAGQLLSLLEVDFSGDMLAKLEAYERDLALYESKKAPIIEFFLQLVAMDRFLVELMTIHRKSASELTCKERHDATGETRCLPSLDKTSDVRLSRFFVCSSCACGDCSEPSDGHRACDALVVEFREIPDVGPLSSRACGCLACESGSVGSLPDTSWSQ